MDGATPTRYTKTAILLHWATAALVIALIGLGWFMVEIPKGPGRSYYFGLHKSLGLTVLLVSVLRLVWRLRYPPPPLPTRLTRWQRGLARWTHGAFYVLLFAQPLSGYLSSAFSGYKTRYFGIPLPHWGYKDVVLNETFTEVHVACSVALVSLIILHLLGAFSHLIRAGDHGFRRMLPW